MRITRLLSISGGFLILFVFASGCSRSEAETSLPTVTVFKSATCGCCEKWVSHLEQSGFETKITNMPDVTPMKEMYGVKASLRSCHTAIVGGYVIEGHVPASDIKRLLREKPDITGLAAPGMPLGSPGMEGSRKDPYNVIAFVTNGNDYVFERH